MAKFEKIQLILKDVSLKLLSFFVVYLVLLLLAPFLILLVIYRGFLSSIFFILYRGRYKLISCTEGTFGNDCHANLPNITIYLYVNGPCDISELRKRFAETFLNHRDKHGGKPYEKMISALVQKWGYLCWESKRSSFDVTDHVRFCPGTDNPEKVYTEDEVFTAVAKLADDHWSPDKPRWEVLVTPQMVRTDSGEICASICFKTHHMYMDGVSVAQIIRNVVVDKPKPNFIFDPVHPPIPHVPWYMTVFLWFQVFLLGPYTCLSMMRTNEKEGNHVFYEGPLKGGKYFGRSRMSIPVSTIKKIRKKFDCCTTAIQHSAFHGAMRRLALSKGYGIPANVVGNVTFANLPYPNEYPTNHLYFSAEEFPLGIESSSRRVMAVDKVFKKNGMFAKITSGIMLHATALLPVALVSQMFASFRNTYLLSNVPGLKTTLNFNGNPIRDIFGMTPLGNGTRYAAGANIYNNHFSFGFIFETSKLIQSQEDVNAFVTAFEEEIRSLELYNFSIPPK